MLKNLIYDHIKFTNKKLAKKIIKNWEIEKNNFWHVVPNEILNKLKVSLFSKKNKDLEKKLA